MMPKSEVFPAPFGPTTPVDVPSSNWKVISSATTTRPKRFETPSSWRSGIYGLNLGVRWLEFGLNRNVRVQRVVNNPRRPRVLLVAHERRRTGLPLDAHRLDDADALRRVGLRRKVQRSTHSVVVHLGEGVGHRLTVVRVLDLLQGFDDNLEERVRRTHRLDPLTLRDGLILRGERVGRHARER